MKAFADYYSEYLLFQMGGIGQLAANFIARLDSDDSTGNALRQHGFSSSTGTVKSQYVPPTLVKQLNEFSVMISPPEQLDFAVPITKTQTEKFAQGLATLGGMIDGINGRVNIVTSQRREAEQLGHRIKEAWNAAFEEKWKAWRERIGRLKKKEDQPSPPRKAIEAIELAEAPKLKVAVEKYLEGCNKSVKAIEKLIQGANQYPKAVERRPSKWLEERQLARYSLIEDLSYAYPGPIGRNRFPSARLTFSKDNTLDFDKGNFLIAGAPGMGKTSFCKWKAMEDLELLQAGKSKRISQYIPLYRITMRDLVTFESAFMQDPKLLQLWENRKSNKWIFRFYLDGLDELADPYLQEKVLQLAVTTKQKDSTVSIIVTGRDYISAPSLRHFVRISLDRFDDFQLDEFVTNWFRDKPVSSDDFRRQLRKDASFQEIVRVPLLGTLVLKVYQTTLSLPGSRVKLYEIFTQLLAGGWDFAKGVNRGSEFGPIVKIAALANLAYRLHEDRKREFVVDDFSAAVADVLPEYASRSEDLLGETCRDGLIVQEGRHYGFLHLSFQEYLVALHLTQPEGQKARRAIRRYLSGEDWWGEVVRFYLALSPTPLETKRYIAKAARALTSRIQPVIIEPRVKNLLDSVALTYPGSSKPQVDQGISGLK